MAAPAGEVVAAGELGVGRRVATAGQRLGELPRLIYNGRLVRSGGHVDARQPLRRRELAAQPSGFAMVAAVRTPPQRRRLRDDRVEPFRRTQSRVQGRQPAEALPRQDRPLRTIADRQPPLGPVQQLRGQKLDEIVVGAQFPGPGVGIEAVDAHDAQRRYPTVGLHVVHDGRDQRRFEPVATVQQYQQPARSLSSGRSVRPQPPIVVQDRATKPMPLNGSTRDTLARLRPGLRRSLRQRHHAVPGLGLDPERIAPPLPPQRQPVLVVRLSCPLLVHTELIRTPKVRRQSITQVPDISPRNPPQQTRTRIGAVEQLVGHHQDIARVIVPAPDERQHRVPGLVRHLDQRRAIFAHLAPEPLDVPVQPQSLNPGTGDDLRLVPGRDDRWPDRSHARSTLMPAALNSAVRSAGTEVSVMRVCTRSIGQIRANA